MKYGVFSANEWMFPDTSTEEGTYKIQLQAAADSTACAQILIRTDKALSWKWMTSEGVGLPLEAPQMNRLIPVYVDKNTGWEHGCGKYVVPQGTMVDYVTRLAPFEVYDPMEPVEGDVLGKAEDHVIPLYVKWSTKEMLPGEYEGALYFAASGSFEQIRIPVTLRVASVKVPQMESLRLTQWFCTDCMADYHGVKRWSEEHWEMIEKYGYVMREGRQTDFWIRSDMVICTKDEKDAYQFDFSRAKRLIHMYLGMGFRYLEGFTPFFRTHEGFVIRVDEEVVSAFSDKGYGYAQAFFTAWYQFLQENGWLGLVNQHVADEPQEYDHNEYRILSGMIRKWMPGVRILEAVESADLLGAVDIWVPKPSRYVEKQECYEEKRKLGDTFWFYTCCEPGGRFLNRLLDQELIRTRYLHWANMVYGFTGYLHWGLNIYNCNWDPSPFRLGCDKADDPTFGRLPSGDTHIVYPKGKEVLRSVRFEMLRAGCEDYELLQMLKEKDSKKAYELLNRCVRSFTDYTLDLKVFEQTYAELLESL